MSVPLDLIREVRGWIEKAEHDLLAAEHTMELASQGLTDVICYHCQQCAEKYLKGLLVSLEIDFPKTHDLRTLLELAQRHSSLTLKKSDVLPLNRYSIEGRYPGDWEPITVEDAEEALEISRLVREEVRTIFPPEILAGEGGQADLQQTESEPHQSDTEPSS